jgi:hypothetical protein
MVAVLYGPGAVNITKRESLKNLLTDNDPGGTVPVRGVIDVVGSAVLTC